MGIMGIGYNFSEASNGATASSFIYPSIIDSMVNQGLINSKGYSLYLDDLQEATGSVIFGGLDSDKYYGNLAQLPIIPSTLSDGSKAYAFPAVVMSGLTMVSKAGQETTFADRYLERYPVILDPGSTVITLDRVIGRKILTAINGVYDSTTTGLVFVDCSLRNKVSTFDFAFGGTAAAPKVTIKVPISELVYNLTGLYAIPDDITLPPLPFKDACAFGIMFSLESPSRFPSIMGDTFLRSAYVVYDLQNNLIGMAQTNFNSSKTNIVEFLANATSIPDVPGVPVPAGLGLPLVTNAPVVPTVAGDPANGVDDAAAASTGTWFDLEISTKISVMAGGVDEVEAKE
jgi:hypothetical protein